MSDEPEALSRTHEKFARFVAQGDSAAAAYRKCYRNATPESIETLGPKLARAIQVKFRIDQLRAAVLEKAKESADKWIKSKAEWVAWLSEGVQTPVALIDEYSPYAQEVTSDHVGDEDGPILKRKVKSIGKIEAIKMIGQWEGHEKGTVAANKEADAIAVLASIQRLTHGSNP